MTYQLIEIKKLDHSARNVRRTAYTAGLDELKASILAHGLMQNLVVVPSRKQGRYEVIAGGRRLRALAALQGEGKLPADHAVPCQVAEDGNATELSFAENIVRQAMHPADQFDAWAALIEQGHTAAEIALRFGCTERFVLQRMKLGRVAPELMSAFRAGQLSLESLMAFAVTDDRERQMSVWRSLHEWQKDDPRSIRSRLTEQLVSSTDKRALFVGADAYQAAGGTLMADLFNEVAYLEHPELLDRLVKERLLAEADTLRQEGWGWVQVEGEEEAVSPYRCRRIQSRPVDVPAELTQALEQAEATQREIADEMDATDADDEEAFDALIEREREIDGKLAEIEDAIDSYRKYDPEEMNRAGCFVCVDHAGKLDIERGLVKPGNTLAPTSDEDVAAHGGESPEKPKREYSQQVMADLAAYRTQAAQVALASSPAVAFDLLVFRAALEMWGKGTLIRDGMDVQFRQTFLRPSVEAKNTATEALEAARDGLELGWLDQEGEDGKFTAFRALGHDAKLAILAYCAAMTLKPTLRDEGRAFPTAYELALSLTGASVAALWRPTRDNYLTRINKEQLFGIGRGFGGETWVSYRRDAKKAALADELHGYFARSANPDTAEAVRNWRPSGMAFLTAPPEVEIAKAKPAKKVTKKAA